MTHQRTSQKNRVSLLVRRLKALANPGRLRIVACLGTSRDPMTPKEMQRKLGLTAPTLSHHLMRLEGAEIVSRERNGAAVLCTSLRPNLRDVASYLHELATADEDLP